MGAEYDGILLDVMLPKKDGYTLVQELRAKGRIPRCSSSPPATAWPTGCAAWIWGRRLPGEALRL